MPPQTVPLALWDQIDDKVRYTLETYIETLSLFAGVTFSRKQAPFVFGALSLLIEAISTPFTEEEAARILSTPEVRFGQPQMWRAVQRIERDMERYYSAKLDLKSLSVFPFYKSARDLVASELSLWGGVPEGAITAPHQSFLMIGCGPLPLAPLLMREKIKTPILCLESDPEDAKRAERFLKKGGVSPEAIKILCADPLTYDYAAHPAIVLMDSVSDKKEILARIRKSDAMHQIAIRAAVGLNTLLYEPLEDQLEAALFVDFDRRTVALPGCLKTTYFSATPEELLIFEKEEPKPDLIDVQYFPPSLSQHGHG